MSMANQSRFPRPPTDLKSIFHSHSPTSVQSGGTSMLNNAGEILSHHTPPVLPQHLVLGIEYYPCQCSAKTASNGLVLQGHPPPSSLSQQIPSTLSLRACRTQQRHPRAADPQSPTISLVMSCCPHEQQEVQVLWSYAIALFAKHACLQSASCLSEEGTGIQTIFGSLAQGHKKGVSSRSLLAW